jgi:Protein of unknown function (DUF2637)
MKMLRINANTVATIKRSPLRLIRLVGISAALGMSGWSIFVLAHDHLHVPFALALIASSMFDGTALIAADLVQKYARTSDSGFLPRVYMYSLVGASICLNNEHGVVANVPITQRLIYVAAPIIPTIEFELTRRWTHRQEMRAVGRVAKALPPFGFWTWIMKPWKNVGVIYQMAERRRNSIPLDYLVWQSDEIAPAKRSGPKLAPEPQPTGPKPRARRKSATSATPPARQNATVAPNVAKGRANVTKDVAPVLNGELGKALELAVNSSDAVQILDSVTMAMSNVTMPATKASETLAGYGWTVSAGTVRKYRSRIREETAKQQRKLIHIAGNDDQA